MTRLTWQDGFYVDYQRRVTGELTAVRENGATSGPGVLATYTYDNLGRRWSLTSGNGVVQWYAYDPVSRLSSMAFDFAGGASDLVQNFSNNPAHQIVSVTRSNDAFAYTGHQNDNVISTPDGLNRLATIAGAGTGYDARGNMTFDPTTGRSFGYWSENELVAASGGLGFGHDAFHRILDNLVNGAVTVQFVHDGPHMIAAYVPGSGLAERFVRGDGADELIATYAGSGTTDRRWAHQDERGSVIALSDATGNAAAINRYDEYGQPQSTNQGRFQYTGQLWLPSIGLYHYKNRNYDPAKGRFMQTDPIGYEGGPNLYAYVGNDPVNLTDPLGLDACADVDGNGNCDDPIEVWGWRNPCSLIRCSTFTSISPFGITIINAGQPGGFGPAPQSVKPCPGPLRRPSSGMMNEPTNKALGSVPGGGAASPLSSEFSRVSRLPNFNSGGWRSVGSIHTSTAYEHDLGDTGKVVKIYVGDSNFGGANTVTITDPTYSISHVLAVPAFELGMPVNARNAAVYLSMTGC